MNDTRAKWGFEIRPFYRDNMANLGLIDFKIGLYYIKVNVNNGKINLKSISQNGNQLAQNRPYATLACGH